MGSTVVYLMDGTTELAAASVLDTSYVLEDGYLLIALTEVVFCRTCCDLGLGERIPSIEEATAAFTHADRYTLKALRKQKTMAYDWAMERKRCYEWRLARVAPPRCLTCGGHDLFVVEGEQCNDPISGHEFTLSQCYLYNDSFPFSSIRLCPDGAVLVANFGPQASDG